MAAAAAIMANYEIGHNLKRIDPMNLELVRLRRHFSVFRPMF